MKFGLKINLRIFDILDSEVLKRTFVRVVKSCPGDPGSGPRVPNDLYVIFKMINYNILLLSNMFPVQIYSSFQNTVDFPLARVLFLSAVC